MMKCIAVTTFFIFVLCVSTHAQNEHQTIKYTIDTSLTKQLKKFRANDSGMLKKSMNLKVFMNERSFWDPNSGPMDGYTNSSLRNDSIFITGHMLGEIGYGFLLALFGDSCTVSTFAYSDSTIYRYRVSDTITVDFITPRCKIQKVTLSKMPSFKAGDIVAGVVDLESNDYYYYLKKPITKFRIKLKMYFQTAALTLTGLQMPGGYLSAGILPQTSPPTIFLVR